MADEKDTKDSQDRVDEEIEQLSIEELEERLAPAPVWAGGAHPGKVNPKAVTAMAELEYDLATHRSKSLDDLPDVEFDAAVTMGCGDACPHVSAKLREDWEIPDPRDMPPEEFRQVRDLISAKVKELLGRV